MIAYILLCGYPPWERDDNDSAQSIAELYARYKSIFPRVPRVDFFFSSIMSAKYNFDPEDWDEVEPEAKDFVQKVLVVNVRRNYFVPPSRILTPLARSPTFRNRSITTPVDAS